MKQKRIIFYWGLRYTQGNLPVKMQLVEFGDVTHHTPSTVHFDSF